MEASKATIYQLENKKFNEDQIFANSKSKANKPYVINLDFLSPFKLKNDLKKEKSSKKNITKTLMFCFFLFPFFLLFLGFFTQSLAMIFNRRNLINRWKSYYLTEKDFDSALRLYSLKAFNNFLIFILNLLLLLFSESISNICSNINVSDFITLDQVIVGAILFCFSYSKFSLDFHCYSWSKNLELLITFFITFFFIIKSKIFHLSLSYQILSTSSYISKVLVLLLSSANSSLMNGNKLKRLSDTKIPIISEIAELCKKYDYNIKNVYFSQNSSLNASCTNDLFNSNIIINYNNYLKKNPRLILAILAHELAHYKKKHFVYTAFMLLIPNFLIIAGLFYWSRKSSRKFKVLEFFIFAYCFSKGISMIGKMINALITIFIEYEADKEIINNGLIKEGKDLFIAFAKESPHFLEFNYLLYFSYSHPPLIKRIESIKILK